MVKTVLFIAAFVLLYIIFMWIHYLVSNDYVREHFTSGTSDSVDLPLTTTYSCKNFCGPTARCVITGQQCFTDIDCPGCQKVIPPVTTRSGGDNIMIPGDNDAGKLTWGVTPQYSVLTSGYGTHERVVTEDLYEKPAQANFGVNTWRSAFDQEEELFYKRYKPNGLEYMPKYRHTYTLTGEFVTDGPLPANAPL
jgi:hypothetical protein